VPDRFSDVAEVHRHLKRESDGTHGPWAEQGMCLIGCARSEHYGCSKIAHYFFPPKWCTMTP
jgi:hypothetical protein